MLLNVQVRLQSIRDYYLTADLSSLFFYKKKADNLLPAFRDDLRGDYLEARNSLASNSLEKAFTSRPVRATKAL